MAVRTGRFQGASSKAQKFQVKLGDKWQDFGDQEDKILKQAFMAGFPNAKLRLRGQNYEYDFNKMVQVNKDTGKSRTIRSPSKLKAPKKPLVPPGKTIVVNVRAGMQGTTIQVPYPGRPGAFIAVEVPASAKHGQAMLVPVPDAPTYATAAATGVRDTPVSLAPSADAPAQAPAARGGWSTGGKVAAGTAGVVAVGGLAVGGVILGDYLADGAIDGAGEAIIDGVTDAAEAVGDFAVDAGDWVVDAAEDTGDFIMDLF